MRTRVALLALILAAAALSALPAAAASGPAARSSASPPAASSMQAFPTRPTGRASVGVCTSRARPPARARSGCSTPSCTFGRGSTSASAKRTPTSATTAGAVRSATWACRAASCRRRFRRTRRSARTRSRSTVRPSGAAVPRTCRPAISDPRARAQAVSQRRGFSVKIVANVVVVEHALLAQRRHDLVEHERHRPVADRAAAFELLAASGGNQSIDAQKSCEIISRSAWPRRRSSAAAALRLSIGRYISRP